MRSNRNRLTAPHPWRIPFQWLQTTKVLLLGLFVVAQTVNYAAADNDKAANGSSPCTRIVSLAPSITEVLYTLSLEDQVVGVTEYCRFPPAALEKPRIGGLFDLSLEVITSLEPSLVVGLAEHQTSAARLRALGLNVTLFDHRTIEGIDASVKELGLKCHRSAQAQAFLQTTQQRRARIESLVRDLPHPRVMVVLGGDFSQRTVRNLYISGNDGFYNGLLRLAGATNVQGTGTVSIPTISAEGILVMDPDVVIQVRAADDPDPLATAETIRSAWNNSFPNLKAVSAGRLYILGQDYASIPGPRYIELLENLVSLIHPEEYLKAASFGEGDSLVSKGRL